MELDVRGEMCPYPAMKAKEALEKLPRDQSLVVLTDHAPALSTVPWEGAKLGFTWSVSVARPGEWRIQLERAAKPIDRNQALTEIARTAAELGVE
jgi:TusA-related sulfurtransferase